MRLLLAKELVPTKRLIQKPLNKLVVDRGQPVVRTLGVGEDPEIGNTLPAPAFLKRIKRLGTLVEELGPVTV